MNSNTGDHRHPPPFAMPAPLAKGLIISLSLLFAAGCAVYENPHVRQWVDQSRRKVAVALYSLGDELSPPSEENKNTQDASTREDESLEAVERRRQARQEILERGRVLEEKSRAARETKAKSPCFDDLVDRDGALKTKKVVTATTSAIEPQSEEAGLRHRTVESKAPASCSNATSAIVNEASLNHFNHEEGQQPEQEDISRSSTPTLPVSPPVPPKPEAYQSHRLLIDTDEVSNHPSEYLVNLTPTTSASSAATDLAELDQGSSRQSPDVYLSVNEWAQDQSIHSSRMTPDSLAGIADARRSESIKGSVADSAEHISQAGTEEVDIMSELGDGISTPGTWTEVGSQVSEDWR